MKSRHYLYLWLLTFLNLKGGGDISKASVLRRNRCHWRSQIVPINGLLIFYLSNQITRFKKQRKRQRVRSETERAKSERGRSQTLPISKSHSCLFSLNSLRRFLLLASRWNRAFERCHSFSLFKVSNGSSFWRWSWKIQTAAVAEPWISRRLLVGSRGRSSMCTIKFFIVSESWASQRPVFLVLRMSFGRILIASLLGSPTLTLLFFVLLDH